MTATYFIAFLAAVALLVIAIVARFSGRRAALRTVVLLVLWFVYIGMLARSGVLQNSTMRPPGIAFVLLPVIVFIVLAAARTFSKATLSLSIPIWILIGGQVFRVGVELFLHQLWHMGLLPRMLTFYGANVDIYVGASAPLIAWLATRGSPGRRAALVWNVLGLLALANVVVRAILTAPGPLNLIHAEVPNLMIGTFPYTLVPAFFVPLAVVLHLLSIKILSSPARLTSDSTSGDRESHERNR